MVKVRQRQLKRHKKDFWAYFRFGRIIRGFCPWSVDDFVKGDIDTLRCFVECENGAKVLTPKQPRLLKAVLEGKKKLNWQINEWAAGLVDGTLLLSEIQQSYPWLPEWAFEAIDNMRWKIIEDKGVKWL